MRISAAHSDVRVRSAGRQNTDKNKNKYPPLLRRQGLFLPPHLRLQTAAYLPQEGGALIFKQGAKRRTKRVCPSSGLSPRVKSGERQAAQAPYPQQIHSERACVLLRTDEQANSVSRRTRRFWRNRPYEQRSAMRCQNLRVRRALLPLFVSTSAIRLVILRIFPVDGKGRRW